ncbi:Uncharacterized protein T06_13684 [Trichinella sp. T6]|nr:Uncharacterized protein T06_13684 [Trichinella sp. T6]
MRNGKILAQNTLFSLNAFSERRKIRLQPITLKLATFQRELVKVKGSCSVNVQYGNIHRILTLIVAKGHCPNLLGLNWFEPLGIHLAHNLMSTPPQISEVLRKYQFAFTEELGIRVIIPLQARHKILKELHIGYPGIVRMKVLARSYVWWPKLDSEIENLVRTCELCQQSRASPPHAPVHNINGLPDIIVSDKGTQLTSHIFQEYLNKGPPHHLHPFSPFANGQAERMVCTKKEFLKKMIQRDWEYNLANFLFCQHATPCTTTGKSRAELLRNQTNFENLRTFQTDDEVYAKNYSSGKTWKPVTVVTRQAHCPTRYRQKTATVAQTHRPVENTLYQTGEETVEAIFEEDTAVVTTPREENAVVSPSPDTNSVGQQRSSTQKRRSPQCHKGDEC